LPRKPKPKPKLEKVSPPEAAAAKVISPGAYKDSSAKSEAYAVVYFAHKVNALGLTESHCVHCGHLIAASRDTRSIQIAEKAHRCR
jgi:hypothetical protein